LGTPTRKALEIEDGLGALGTELAANPGREGAALSFDVLTRNLAPAMDIVSDVVQHPTYPADEFAREKKRVLDQLAQADRNGAAPLVTVPPPTPAPAGRLYLVDRPDAAQTVVAQYLPAPTRTSADYDALTLVDAVWGGGGVSTRLNLNLRENKGYSYGVFSSF